MTQNVFPKSCGIAIERNSAKDVSDPIRQEWSVNPSNVEYGQQNEFQCSGQNVTRRKPNIPTLNNHGKTVGKRRTAPVEGSEPTRTKELHHKHLEEDGCRDANDLSNAQQHEFSGILRVVV